MMESKMSFSKLPIFLVIFILLSLSPTPAFAAKKSYIVYMGTPSHKGRKMSEKALGQVSDSHCKFLASFLGSTKKAKDSIFYSYQGYINGFAAVLDEEEAAKISKDPNVVSVFKNELFQLHTTKSWNFLSLENNNGVADSNSLWTKARQGEDIIIGNLDSGVNPELESFSDKGYGPIPKKWKGICQNDTKNGFACNKKLIGARYFYKGFHINRKLKDYSNFSTPRDHEGHGTHTLSTAGGNIVPGANIIGAASGIAKGGAPRARVAAYKVCWPPVDGEEGGCSEADILKAFDQAIRDGVDVLSVSLGSAKPTDYFDDATAIGAFHAAKHGIVVVASAGNEGPGDSTTVNPAPWILTVAASTMDREIVADVELANGARFKGFGVFKPMRQEKPIPILTGAQAKTAKANEKEALACKEGALDPQKVKGKIVVCLRGGGVDRADKSVNAARAGAAGMILCNDKADGDAIVADPHIIPASHLNYTAGQALFAYINSTQNPQGTIKDSMTQLNTKPAPVMAGFSSKGPNIFTPEILKPDITAPGVSVLAAFGLPISGFDKQVFPFTLMSGTSMSCPHVSGIAALLKAIHPDWSPAAIRSAIMTTASTIDNTGGPILNSSNIKATPFSYGAGHVQPNLAADPGLVYDLTPSDYKKFLCAIGYETHKVQRFAKKHVCPNFTDPLTVINLNYPSITVPKVSGSATVRRTLKNVGPPGNYKARVVSPQGFSVIIKPDVFKFTKGGEQKTFSVTLKEDQKSKKASDYKGYSFGELIWSDGVHNVRSPIVVAKDAPQLTPEPEIPETLKPRSRYI